MNTPIRQVLSLGIKLIKQIKFKMV